MESIDKNDLTTKVIKIFYIEDDETDDQLFRLMLSRSQIDIYDFEVVSARTFTDARKVISENTFDVIISDMNLPDSSGWETVANLIHSQSSAPIILLTGTFDEGLELKAIQNGVEAYLDKDNLSPEIAVRTIIHCIERHMLRKKLVQSENRLRKIINQNGDGVVVLDESGVVIFANPTAEKMFKVSCEKLIGTHLGIPVSKENLTVLSLLDKDFKEISVEVQITMIEWEEKQAYLATLRDITQRKEVERLTKEKEMLENVRYLAGAIAHEFAQPLQIIGHALELYMMESGSSKRLDICKKNLKRAGDLVHQIQNIVSLETRPYLNSKILDIAASSAVNTNRLKENGFAKFYPTEKKIEEKVES